MLLFITKRRPISKSQTTCAKVLDLLLGLLGVDLPCVEVQLLAFEDVSISAAGLSRARGDSGVKSATDELLINGVIKVAVALSLGDLVLASLGLGTEVN